MALPITAQQPDRMAPATTRGTAASFLLARLGSLFAFLPLAVWTVCHLWAQLAAFDGPDAWQDSVTRHDSSAGMALTAAFVLLPLLWHTVWGMVRMFRSRPKATTPYFSNLRYLVQRLSALGLLAFLIAHIWKAWAAPRFGDHRPEPFDEISAYMHHHAPTLFIYLLGILAISYHLANGLWSFCMGWGLTVSRSSQRWAEKLAIALFVVLLVIGWAAIFALYRAGANYPPPADL